MTTGEVTTDIERFAQWLQVLCAAVAVDILKHLCENQWNSVYYKSNFLKHLQVTYQLPLNTDDKVHVTRFKIVRTKTLLYVVLFI